MNDEVFFAPVTETIQAFESLSKFAMESANVIFYTLKLYMLENYVVEEN